MAAQEDAELTQEDILNQWMAARQRQPNVSYYAFTATPKPKTLELFGRIRADGTPAPFHVYSMRPSLSGSFWMCCAAAPRMTLPSSWNRRGTTKR